MKYLCLHNNPIVSHIWKNEWREWLLVVEDNSSYLAWHSISPPFKPAPAYVLGKSSTNTWLTLNYFTYNSRFFSHRTDLLFLFPPNPTCSWTASHPNTTISPVNFPKRLPSFGSPLCLHIWSVHYLVNLCCQHVLLYVLIWFLFSFWSWKSGHRDQDIQTCLNHS
jgi:hypothetical protein